MTDWWWVFSGPPLRLNPRPFAYEMVSLNAEAPCRAGRKTAGLIAKTTSLHLFISFPSLAHMTHLRLLCMPIMSVYAHFTGYWLIYYCEKPLGPLPSHPHRHRHPPLLFLHCNQPDNSTFMTYSLHKQTQFQTAAQQTLLKHILPQPPL